MTPFHVCARSTPVPVLGPPVGWTRIRCACICTQHVEVDAIRPRMVGARFLLALMVGPPFFGSLRWALEMVPVHQDRVQSLPIGLDRCVHARETRVRTHLPRVH